MGTLIVGLAALICAVGMVCYLLLVRPASAEVLGVSVIGAAGGARPRLDEGRGPQPSTLSRLGTAIGTRCTPKDYARRAQQRLDLAGNPGTWSPPRLVTTKGYGVLAGVSLGMLLGLKHGLGITVFAVLLLGVFGLFLPDIYIHNLGEHRQQDLQRGLPDALDMMTVCVEAGLGFDAALARVARNLDGPVAQEFARVLQEMQIGMSRTTSLRALSARTEVPELRSFVTSIVQSSELGISVGDVLREQSKSLRVKRRHRAEEKAQKLQVKLLFPLIICLLPAMFIVVLGPAVIQIMTFFSKAGV